MDLQTLEQCAYERSGYICVPTEALAGFVKIAQHRTWLFNYLKYPEFTPTEIFDALLFTNSPESRATIYKSYPPEFAEFCTECFLCKTTVQDDGAPRIYCKECASLYNLLSRVQRTTLLHCFKDACSVTSQAIAVASPLHIDIGGKLKQPYWLRKDYHHADQRPEANLTFIKVESFSDL